MKQRSRLAGQTHRNTALQQAVGTAEIAEQGGQLQRNPLVIVTGYIGIRLTM